MKSAVLACLMAAAAAQKVALTAKSDFDDMVDKINKMDAGWTAEAPLHRFGSLTDVKTVCGTFMPGHPQYFNVTLKVADEDVNPLVDIPTEFDARTAWPKCTIISKVRDQSSCGSCWAFSATETFEDRRCVATGEDVEFSAEDTAGCCHGFMCGLSNGCNGGQPGAALRWMTNQGVVTGADYFNRSDASGGCKPYSLKPCAHHVPATSRYPKCPGNEYQLQCEKKCTDQAAGKSYDQDKTRGSSAESLSTVEGMQTAIMKGGPLSVALTVYSDFPNYKSGVYKHVSGEALGGHAVEMVGWGEENGTPYWLIKNSWNEQWGDGGFFKILRGQNECGIEGMVNLIRF